jgi:ABC-2 type transport system ATP-binding protein
MISHVQLPGPFSRVPLAWVIAVIAFAISGFFVATKGVNGNALIFAAVGVIFLVRGGMLFAQRMRRRQAAAEPGVVDPGPAVPTAPSAVAESRPAIVPNSTGAAPSPAAVIEARDLVKRYDEVLAVDGVSFTVRRGEIFGLLGPNGAGKTTTLEMLEGLTGIDAGTAIVLGSDIKRDAVAVKRRIGVQLQATALPSYTTVLESIDLFRSFYAHTRDAAELIEEFDLVPQTKRITTKLSGGQQQRLSIALAMVNDPELVFLDEPTTGLDPQARIALWGFIERFRARGKTVMITTHYMEEAERLCDRVAVMDQGHIVALDTPDRLIALHGPGTSIEYSSRHADEATLRALTGVDSVHVSGTNVQLHTRRAEIVLAQLLHPEGAGPDGMSNLRVEHGTLEDVFLALTGRGLES